MAAYKRIKKNAMTTMEPKYHSAKAKCSPEIAEALLRLVVAAGNKANVNEPKLKMPHPYKQHIQFELKLSPTTPNEDDHPSDEDTSG